MNGCSGDADAGHDQAGGPKATRSQSEVIGTVLLVGVVVITVSLVGAFVLSTAIEEPGPEADFVLTIDADSFELAHDGGDSLAADSVVVRLAGDADDRIELASFGETQGDGDSRFEAGEIRSHGHDAAETLTVFVIHDPSDTVLFRDSADVP